MQEQQQQMQKTRVSQTLTNAKKHIGTQPQNAARQPWNEIDFEPWWWFGTVADGKVKVNAHAHAHAHAMQMLVRV